MFQLTGSAALPGASTSMEWVERAVVHQTARLVKLTLCPCRKSRGKKKGEKKTIQSYSNNLHTQTSSSTPPLLRRSTLSAVDSQVRAMHKGCALGQEEHCRQLEVLWHAESSEQGAASPFLLHFGALGEELVCHGRFDVLGFVRGRK